MLPSAPLGEGGGFCLRKLDWDWGLQASPGPQGPDGPFWLQGLCTCCPFCLGRPLPQMAPPLSPFGPSPTLDLCGERDLPPCQPGYYCGVRVGARPPQPPLELWSGALCPWVKDAGTQGHALCLPPPGRLPQALTYLFHSTDTTPHKDSGFHSGPRGAGV